LETLASKPTRAEQFDLRDIVVFATTENWSVPVTGALVIPPATAKVALKELFLNPTGIPTRFWVRTEFPHK